MSFFISNVIKSPTYHKETTQVKVTLNIRKYDIRNRERYSEQRGKSCTSWQKFHHEVQIHRILEGEKHFHHPSAKKKEFFV